MPLGCPAEILFLPMKTGGKTNSAREGKGISRPDTQCRPEGHLMTSYFVRRDSAVLSRPIFSGIIETAVKQASPGNLLIDKGK